MSDQPTPGVSLENPETGSSSAEGHSGSTASAGGALPTGGTDSQEARIRDFQSKFDRAAAENATLRARVAALESRSTDEPTPSDTGYSGPTPADIRSEVEQSYLRVLSLTQEADELRSTYPDVAELYGELFDRSKVLSYDSPETLRAAVEAANGRIDAIKAKLGDNKGGATPPDPGPGPVDTGGGTGGALTVEDIHGMSFAEQQALESEHPGLIRKILTQAMR